MRNVLWAAGMGMIIWAIAAFTNSTSVNVEPAEQIEWISISEAWEKSREEPRVIFVDVYTDWCGWCKVMDKKTFNDPAVISFVNEHYYAVKMDAEDNKKFLFKGEETSNRELTRKFRVTGFPTVVLMDKDFENVKPRPGYRNAESFRDMLEQHLDRYARR